MTRFVKLLFHCELDTEAGRGNALQVRDQVGMIPQKAAYTGEVRMGRGPDKACSVLKGMIKRDTHCKCAGPSSYIALACANRQGERDRNT